MTDSPGSFEVTLRDVYADVKQSNALLSQGISDLKASLFDLRTDMRLHNEWRKGSAAREEDIETRVRKLEKWRHSVPSAILLSTGSTILAIAELMATRGTHG